MYKNVIKMQNVNLYYKYIIRPQLLLKNPKIKNSTELSNFMIKKIRLNMFLLDSKNNYYIYLYNICILIRLIFNKFLFLKKISKNFNFNKLHIQISIENNQIFIFLDIFSTFLLPLFENFNMGLKENEFDIFGNFTFEFNYSDPVFMSKNTIIVWSPTNKVRIIFYFFNKNKIYNILLLRYFNIKYYYLK